MKKLLVLLPVLLFVFSTQSLWAQPKRPLPQTVRAERQTRWMTKALDLTEDQKESVYDINLKYVKLMDNARQEHAGDKDKKIEAFKVIQDDKDTELQGVLSEDQFITYKEKQKKHREKRKENRKDQKDRGKKIIDNE